MANETKLDVREFQRALVEYIPTTKKSLAQICNERALNIAARAIPPTPKAEKQKIEALGVVGYTVLSKKGTRLKRAKAILSVGGRMRDIYVARMIKRGENPKDLTAKEIADRVKRALGARLRSIGFIKSGWLPAMKRLGIAAGKQAKLRILGDSKTVGRDKGYAIEAKPGFTPSATIVNMAGSLTDDNGHALVKFGAPALQQAVNAEARELLEHTARKLQADANKINGR